MNDVERSVQAITAFIFLRKYCKTEKCKKCVFNTGGNGCGLVAALSERQKFSTVLDMAINRRQELEVEFLRRQLRKGKEVHNDQRRTVTE